MLGDGLGGDVTHQRHRLAAQLDGARVGRIEGRLLPLDALQDLGIGDDVLGRRLDVAFEIVQATAEDIAADAGVLQLVEAQKATLEISDPKVLELAKRAAELAQGLVTKTVAERELVLEAGALARSDASEAADSDQER